MERRGFAFVFLERFLGVVAIKNEMGDRRRRNEGRGRISLHCGNGSPVFYAWRLVASRKDCLAVLSEKRLT